MIDRHRIIALLFMIAGLPTGFCADEYEDKLRKSLDSRLAIESAHFEAVVFRKKFVSEIPEAAELEGGLFKYTFHWSKDNSRVDCVETRSLAGSKDRKFRFSKLDLSLRVVDAEGDTMVKEFLGDIASGSIPFTYKRLNIDPRYLGYWPTTFEQMRSFTIAEITSLIEPAPGLTFDWEMDANSTLNRVSIRGLDPQSRLTWEFELLDSTMVPAKVKLVGFSGEGNVDEISTEWQMVDGIAFPLRSEYVRTQDSETTIIEEWSFKVIALNRPIDESLHSWESLGLWEKAVVKESSGEGTSIKQWKDGKFGDWIPTPLVEVSHQGSKQIHSMPILLGCVFVVIGVVLVLCFRSK